jgi:TRAP-type C4-dicarboxylate transport system substrate-binding protein
MVTDAPGMFDDMAHAQRALEYPKFRDKFVNMGAEKGFIINYLWACGDTSIATVKPFKTLDDLKGRKIRVLATPLEREVIKSMGATGIPMPYSEVLPGMQRKTIDGVRSAIIVMHPSKFWTVAKHITLTGMGQISCGQFLSTAWLKTLPDDLRQIVMDSGKAVQPMSAGASP